MRKCGDILHERDSIVNVTPSAIYHLNRSHRLLGLAIPALARRLLPRRPSFRTLARVLRSAIRHRRDQQLVLSAARANSIRVVAALRPTRVRLRSQGEPVSDAYEEVERSGGARGAILLPRASAGTDLGPRAVSTPAAMVGKCRAARDLSPGAAGQAAPRVRIPRTELVFRQGLRAAPPAPGGVVPARHGGVDAGTS